MNKYKYAIKESILHSLVFGLCWMQGTLAHFHCMSLFSSCQRQFVRLLVLWWWPWKFWGAVALCFVESLNCSLTFFPWWFQQGFWGSWRRPRGEASSDRVTASIVHSTMDGALSWVRQLPNISAVKCPFTSFPHLTFGKKFSHTWGGVALCLTEGGLLT